LLLIHGNASSGRFYEHLLPAISGYYAVAPDLRGFGATEPKIVDATRGMRDFSDDLHVLLEALGLERVHLLGWSMGAHVALQYLLDHPARVRSLTLLAPGSPFGYGGTHGLEGAPNFADFAGTGAGLISREARLKFAAQDARTGWHASARSAL